MADRPAGVSDVHRIAASMPHVKRLEGPKGNAIYQVGGKSFVFFRTAQPDATDPDTGERYADVIMLWVESESDKLALVQDPTSPFFTTGHFDGHPSVLVRACRLSEVTATELTELIQDAWLSRASGSAPRRGSPPTPSVKRRKRSSTDRRQLGVNSASTMFRHECNG